MAKKNIKFFSSIEDENEYTRRQYAAMSPEERLAIVTRMRLNAYPHLDQIKLCGEIVIDENKI